MNQSTSQTFLIELNEINIDYVRKYGSLGKLRNLNALIDTHGLSETTSEKNYDELEPWIQWVTAHTGMPLAEHGVFRLGDIVNFDFPQVWEDLEEQGVSVGAISPMNAKNRTKNACFFVPDPWTETKVTGSALSRKLYAAIAQVVNDNAKSKVTLSSLLWLLIGAGVYARPVNYLTFFKLILSAKSKPWSKAMFLDLLLADMFIKLSGSHRPSFASLFVNAGAHVQHHYLFSSEVYEGDLENPAWYVDPDVDPVLEVYEIYDRIIGQVISVFPKCRMLIATGLHQDPYPKLDFYWRLREHASFLTKHSIPYTSVEPRMSRDFLIRAADPDQAAATELMLNAFVDKNGLPLFAVDNRGLDLFVMLTYPHDIPADFRYWFAEQEFAGLRDDVAFVAIKNGQHNGDGYFIDTGEEKGAHPKRFPLAQLYDKVTAAVRG